MRRVRGGPSVREFLEYYLLVLLGKKGHSKRELTEAIREESAANRSYRASGVLRVASSEMDRALGALHQRGWIRPMSSPGKWTITADGRRARRRIKRQHADRPNSKEKAARKLLSLLRSAPQGRSVLDVGTGEGYLALKLARKGFQVLGIDSGIFDYSKESIQKAREQADSYGGKVEFRKADVTRLPESEGTFDYVVTSQAIHCMRNPMKCLQAIYRLLKPSGKFVSLDFSVGVKGFLAHGFHCLLALSPEEWEQVLPDCGFRQIQMYQVDDYLLVEARKPNRQLAGKPKRRKFNATL